ncbi:MAG: choice-of-anchor L domain-containing protein [Caldilineaceae bacterium]|nr:choice-of-anchor L domain-containing protein [Caldilineaceae bacterium]
MKVNSHVFAQTVVRQTNSRRFFAILMVLALLLGHAPLARASAGDNGRVASVSSSAAAQDTDPGTLARNLAQAMGVPEGDILAADLMGSDTSGVAVEETPLGKAGFPTQGSTFAVLSTGVAADASLPNDEENRGSDLGGLSNSQGQDLVRLHLQLKVPDKINCASFGFAYYSEEFPEYVNSQYNDTFSAQINESDLPITDNAVSAPGNFAFDTEGNIVSINTSFGVQADTGTTYDGATPPLSAQTAVVPGSVIDLYFSVQDLGDSVYDSAVFLDKFFWSEDPNCKEGAKVDTDGDGLLDIWETEGLTVTVGGVPEFVNLPAMGADPQRKDIFVEIDYMVEYTGTNDIGHTHQPIASAIADVVSAFASAPVTNTDGTTGIRLHVDYGKNAPLTYGITTTSGSTPTWGALSRSDAITETANLGETVGQYGYSWAAFDQIKQTHFSPGRAAVFHYSMWIHKLAESFGKTSGYSRNPSDFDSGASDFIVSLGGWRTSNVGGPWDQAGTFMHELGHNLGLRHGGTEEYNYKPNYLSVMNYAFQFDGLIKNSSQGNFDYSRFKLPDLNEPSLDEAASLITTTATTDTYGTYWFCGAQLITSTNTLTSPVDWNCDSVISTTVAANVNAGWNDQPDAQESLLKGASDWDRLVYMGGALGLPGATVILPDVTEVVEMTEEQSDRIPALFPEILAAAPDTVETWALQSTYTGHTGPVWGVAWSPDGSQFASGAEDGVVRVWDAATGVELAALTGPGGEVYGVAWSPDGSLIAAGSADTLVWVWDAVTGEVVASLEGHTGAVRSVAWSPDGSRLASGSADGAVRTWDVATWAAENTLSGHTDEVNSVAWSPDGAELASGSDDMTVRVWDAATGAALATYEGHTDRVWSVAWSPDGARLASGSEDGTVRIWDMVFDAFLTTLTGHTDGVRSVAWSPDGAQLASGAMDLTARVWDVAAERSVATLEGFVDYVNSLAWSPDGNHLLTGAGDASVQMWSREAFKEHAQWDIRAEIVGLGVSVLSAAWSPTDGRVAYGTGDGALRIWDTETGEVLTIFDAHTDGISVVGWSPDGSNVATAANDHTVKVWDATTGENLGVLEIHITHRGIPWSPPNGERLASNDGDGENTVRISDAATGETIATLAGHAGEVAGVAWSPDGSQIATASLDQTVRVWDAATGENIATFEGHSAPVNTVAWSPDGNQLASGADDMTVRVWNVAAGESQATLEGHTDRVMSVAWSPDGSQLASASADGTIRIWDVAAGATLATLTGHTAAVRSVTWSTQGDLLASAGDDGSVRIWNAVAERIWITPESASSSSPDAATTGDAQSNTYNVENQWGGTDAPWNPGGVWVIGGRADQRVVALTASSEDGGETLVGTMTYAGEGPIGFRAFRTAQNTYEVENQWGGDDAPWNPGGTWVLGGRDEQSVVDIAIASEDDGSTLAGVMTYDGEGPIGFRAFLGDDAAAPAAEEPATAEAQAVSCDPAAIPPAADTGVMLRFVNNSDAMGFVYWLDFDNQLQEYAVLAPGESYDQATFEGHQWEVYDANPQEVDDASTHLMISYTASAEPGQCVVIER